MRPFAVIVLLCLGVLALPQGAAHDPDPSGPHSPNVDILFHDPSEPARGKPVRIWASVYNESAVANLTLVYCRVEAYACGPALTMQRYGPAAYTTEIPWNKPFFDGARTVGYNLTINYLNRTHETSPKWNYPSTPQQLPAEAGNYYFYTLPEPPPESPGVGWWGAAAVLGVLAWRRASRR